jgi:hypothetical protein
LPHVSHQACLSFFIYYFCFQIFVFKFYFEKEKAFQRKLNYYGVNIYRKFSVENNAPFFRILITPWVPRTPLRSFFSKIRSPLKKYGSNSIRYAGGRTLYYLENPRSKIGRGGHGQREEVCWGDLCLLCLL